LNQRCIPALDDLYRSRTKEHFTAAAIKIGRASFGTAVVAFHEVKFSRACDQLHVCDDRRVDERLRSAWWQHALDSPVVRYYRSGGTDPVIGTSALVSESAWRDTRVYADCWKPLGVKYQIGLRLWDRSQILGLSIKRDSRFFDEDVTLMRSLYPHFLRAYRAMEDNSEQLVALGLTRRESAVMRWVIRGKRDSEIAIILGCSTRTISKHMENVLSKLAVENRLAAAAYIQDWLRTI